MSAPDSSESIPEEVTPPPPAEKKKRQLSPEALAKLAAAREKAAEVKKAMREAQSEIEKHKPKPPRKIDVLTAQLAELKAAAAKPPAAPAPDPPPVVRQRTNKPARPAPNQPVYILEHSSSDDDSAPSTQPIVYVRKKKKPPSAPAPAPAPTPPPTPRPPRAPDFNPFFAMPQPTSRYF